MDAVASSFNNTKITDTQHHSTSTMMRSHRRYFSMAFILLVYLALVASNDDVCTNDATSETCQNDKPKPPRVPDSCGIVMAKSSLLNAGWGVFSMVDRQKGTEITRGDIVIQITDPNPEHLNGMKLLVDDYAWQGQATGGQYERTNVLSLVPGLGMLANSYYKHHNILPLAPQVDEGGLTRFDSPGAGAITHYHNYSWYTQKDVYANNRREAVARVVARTRLLSGRPTAHEIQNQGRRERSLCHTKVGGRDYCGSCSSLANQRIEFGKGSWCQNGPIATKLLLWPQGFFAAVVSLFLHGEPHQPLYRAQCEITVVRC
jgi:hypothetical protein